MIAESLQSCAATVSDLPSEQSKKLKLDSRP